MARNDTKQADVLIQLGNEAELWHTPDGRPFATVNVGGAQINYDVQSSQFRTCLAGRFWEDKKTAASNDALNRAVEVLAGQAFHEGEEHDAFIRVARKGNVLYLDLGCPEWHVIEVTAEGWQPCLDAPVRFYRGAAVGTLPWPQSGGSIDDLRPFVNVQDDYDFVLAVAWMLGAFNPDGPFPIALIQGEQGSAKSTLTRVLRSIVDPATPPHTTRPTTERDLAIAAHGSWVQAFDNLSTIPDWLSDAFCRIATGGGFKTRKLYQDTDEIILNVCRPQILNGIEDLATRDDLRDRGILLELPVIAGGQRRRERDFWASFEEAQPRVLGALLDAASAALRGEEDVRPAELPRMADFAVWVTAGEESLPWEEGTFGAAYKRNRSDAIAVVLEHNAVAKQIIRFAETCAPWEGTATELFNEIWRGIVPHDPRKVGSPASMSQELRRLTAALRHVGVDVQWYRENDSNRTRKIAVRAVQPVQIDAPR